jgi:hypothetical protein
LISGDVLAGGAGRIDRPHYRGHLRPILNAGRFEVIDLDKSERSVEHRIAHDATHCIERAEPGSS